MSFVCLSIPGSPTVAASNEANGAAATRRPDDSLGIELLRLVPHVAGERRERIFRQTVQRSVAARHRGRFHSHSSPTLVLPEPNEHPLLVWLDARGLGVRRVAESALEIAQHHGADQTRAGAARTPIAAEVAATCATTVDPLVLVPTGGDPAFLAAFPLSALAPAHGTSPRLAAALADVGITTCGELARLSLESIEVRFGVDGVTLWRLARAEDRRRVFPPRTRALPSASLAWEEYALRDPERLLFVANRLAESVCSDLRSWGEGARAMTLGFSLVSRTLVERPLRAARATGSRSAWLRLIRSELDRLKLPDAVSGLSLRVDAVGASESPQGDLFDRGFQSASAVEEALQRIVDDRHAIVVGLTMTGHPLLERRMVWHERPLHELAAADEHRAATSGTAALPLGIARPPDVLVLHEERPANRSAALALQLLPAPIRIAVTTERRRGHKLPVRYRVRTTSSRTEAPLPQAVMPNATGSGSSEQEIEILTTTGPDRISGGDETGSPFAREYFHCLTSDGTLVLLYRDARSRRKMKWYLHGWWD
jgi:hypothetical protein